jgi:hypothetical protein
VLVIVSWGSAGGLWITPIPFTWSVRTRFLSDAPPVFFTTIVYVSAAPEATELADPVLTTVIGLAGSARVTGANVPTIEARRTADPNAVARRLRIEVRMLVRPNMVHPPAPMAQLYLRHSP